MRCPNPKCRHACEEPPPPQGTLEELLYRADHWRQVTDKPWEILEELTKAVKDLRASNGRLHKLADFQLHENEKLRRTMKYLRDHMARARDILREEEE